MQHHNVSKIHTDTTHVASERKALKQKFGFFHLIMAHSSISNYSSMFFQEKTYGMTPDFELYINCTHPVDLKEMLNK